MTDLGPHDLTALQQSAAIRAGDLSCQELTRHYLERTERWDRRVGAYITVIGEQAIEQARRLDRLLARGEAPESPLFGTIAPVKDLDLVAGVRTTFGSRAMSEFVAPVDASFVSRMRAAGLVISGKTNTPEFGQPCYTENLVAPPARTPWDLTRSAGGSSGGAAAAVSTGLASLAQGSDGGGSIRIPASVTGLVGIKPSRGRVSQAPLVPPLGELPVIGPLARTVADAAALLDVLAGAEVGDPFPAPPGGDFLTAARRAPPALRVARSAVPLLVDAPLSPVCLDAYEHAARVLADLGHEVLDVDPPLGPDDMAGFEPLWYVGIAAAPLPVEAEELLTPMTRHLRRRGKEYSGPQVAAALSGLRLLAARVVRDLAPYDAFLTPSLAQPPAVVGALRNDDDPAADFEAQKAFTPYTAVFNVTGQPAIGLPLHEAHGLPIGVQLVGRPGDEETIISLGAQMEAHVGRAGRHPPMW